MINHTVLTSMNTSKNDTFGIRLKAARESLGMERKEAAAQLRLNEKIIIMIENGEYKTDIPMTFIRGYIRNYSKLVGIPEKEILEAMELMKPKAESEKDEADTSTHTKTAEPASLKEFSLPTLSNLFMPLFTLLIVITLGGLVGIWWHSHKASPHELAVDAPAMIAPPIAENQIENPASEKPVVAPVVQKTPDQTLNPAQQAKKSLFANIVYPDSNTRWFMNVILFLLLVTASMRLFAKPMMANVRRNKRLARPKSHTDNIFLFDVKPILQISVIVIVLVSAVSGAWWFKHLWTNKQIAAAKAQAAMIAKTEAAPEDNLQLYADLEALAPTTTLSSIMKTSIQPYMLQNMMNQLNDYITQVTTVRAYLTDKTIMGEFMRKKKRRVRTYPTSTDANTETTNTYSNNTNQQNTQYNNSPPSYYSNQ